MLNISNEALVKELKDLAKSERKITHEILIRINEFERRKLYFEYGYPSVIEWLIGELHYSEGAAYRRRNAARVLRDVPSVAEKIQSGSLTLSSLATLQTAIQSEERRTHAKVTPEDKQELTSRLEKKSKLETAKVLGSAFPELNLKRNDELRPVSASESQSTARVSEKARVALERARELLSHAMPEASWGEIIERLADNYLKQNDPLLKPRANAKRENSARKPSEARPTLMAQPSVAQLSGAQPSATQSRLSKNPPAVPNATANPSNATGHLVNPTETCAVAKSDLMNASRQTGLTAEAIESRAPSDKIASQSTQGAFAAKSQRTTSTTTASTTPNASNTLTTSNTPNVSNTPNATIRPRRKAIAVSVGRAVMQRDDGRCQMMDSRTGRICGSRWQVELDHITPWALGGEDTIENLRCVCRRHNADRSEKMFGPWKK